MKKLFSEVIPAQLENIHIFSVFNSPGEIRGIDVWFAVHGSPYYKAEKLNGNVAVSKTRVCIFYTTFSKQIAIIGNVFEYLLKMFDRILAVSVAHFVLTHIFRCDFCVTAQQNQDHISPVTFFEPLGPPYP